jgi:hypothetical protein
VAEVKVLFDNIALAATLAAGSASPNYPVENIVDHILKKRFQSTLTSDTITLTWATDQTIDCCFAEHTNAKSFIITLYDSADVVLYRQRFSPDAKGIHFAAVSGVRKATLSLYNIVAGETYVYLGALGLGQAYTMPDPVADWNPTPQDNSSRRESPDGQVEIQKVPRLRKLALAFRVFTMELFFYIESLIGEIVRPIFIDPFERAHLTTALAGSWDFAGLPECPDSTTDRTYLSNWSSGVDGWTGTGATLSASGGELVITATGATIKASKGSLTSATLRTVRVKYKSPRTGTVSIKGTVGGVADTTIKDFTYSVANTWMLLDCYIAGALTLIYVTQAGMTTSDVARLSFAYVGTGAYLSTTPDLSGNGQAGTVYGCTPSANGLVLDGTNDRIVLANPSQHTGAFTVIARVQGKARSTIQFLYSRTTGADAGEGIDLLISTDNKPYLRISPTGATAARVITGSPGAGTAITEDCILAFEFEPSTFMRIRKNGSVIIELTTGVPALAFYSAAQTEAIGARGPGTSSLFDGWIEYLHVLDYVPDAAELARLSAKAPTLYDSSKRYLPIYGTFDGGMQNISKNKDRRSFEFSLTAKEAR